MDDLESHSKAGASWEGFILDQLIRRLGAAEEECYFWATHSGAELDLLLVTCLTNISGNSIIRMEFAAIRVEAAMGSPPNMNSRTLSNLKRIFEKFPQVKLVYFFGSQAEGTAGPLSDYDFAVYVETARKSKSLDIRLRLMAQIGRLLKTEKVDVVILNEVAGPEMKYLVISSGRLIFEREPYKVLVEPRILHEYFDFREMLLRYKLTSAG